MVGKPKVEDFAGEFGVVVAALRQIPNLEIAAVSRVQEFGDIVNVIAPGRLETAGER